MGKCHPMTFGTGSAYLAAPDLLGLPSLLSLSYGAMQSQNLQQARRKHWSPRLPAAHLSQATTQVCSALTPYSTSSTSFCFRSLSNKIQKKDKRERKK